jgi:hypothetical protein
MYWCKLHEVGCAIDVLNPEPTNPSELDVLSSIPRNEPRLQRISKSLCEEGEVYTNDARTNGGLID